MGIVYRQSVKTALVIMIGAVLGAAINYVYPFILAKDDLGFLTNFIAQGAVLQFIVLLGTGPLIQTWTGRFAEDDERRSLLFTICILTPVLCSLILAIPYIALKDTIVALYKPQDRPSVIRYYYWMLPFVLFWALSSIMDQYLISQIRVAVAAFVREVGLRIGNLLLILLMFWKKIGFEQFLAGYLILYGLSFLALFAYSRKRTIFRFSANLRAFSGEEYRKLIHFSWYHLLLGISLTVTGYIDVLLLAPLDQTGMSSLAVYRNAVFIATLMVLPYRAISAASVATLNDAFIKGDMPRLRSLFQRSGTNIFLATTLLTALIAVNVFDLVRLFPAGYEAIAPVTLILLLGKLVDMFTGLNNELIGISQYYKFNFRISAILLVATIIFDRLLIPRYGIYGAAWASSSILIVYNAVKILFLHRKMQIHPFDRGSFYILIAGIAAGLGGWCVPDIAGSAIATMVVKSAVVGLIYCLGVIYLKPSMDLSLYLAELRKRKRLF